MSTTIEHVTINGSNDGRLILANSQIARLLATQDFARIRIGLRIAFDDTGASLTGTPRFWFGLLALPQTDANGNLINGPANLATSHFVGAISNSSGWFRNTSGYTWGQGAPHFSAIKKVGADITFGGSVNPYQPNVSNTPDTKRTVVLLDIKRGTPVFTIMAGFPNNSGDLPYSMLEQAMSVPDFTAANQVFGSPSIGSGTIAVDEGVDGILNAVCLHWDRQTPTAHLSEVLFSFFPS